ncbi:MAG: aromatic-ring-hydroxylating dioxygenase subunit beta [Candidimonas sp.]|nr:aromatic-ring-hydroxylating dioxygenase subunit beta [Candidimonas sp.]
MTAFTDQQLSDFVYDEARLLDEQHYEKWLNLFTDDAYYWMPLSHGQTDPLLEGSLMYEDKLLLRVRIERLTGQRTYSQQPKSRSHHLLQRPTIEVNHAWHQPSQGQYTIRAAFHYIETRLDQQTLYAGWSTFQLIDDNGQLRIKQKRVDLVNCDSAMRSIQLFM